MTRSFALNLLCTQVSAGERERVSTLSEPLLSFSRLQPVALHPPRMERHSPSLRQTTEVTSERTTFDSHLPFATNRFSSAYLQAERKKLEKQRQLLRILRHENKTHHRSEKIFLLHLPSFILPPLSIGTRLLGQFLSLSSHSSSRLAFSSLQGLSSLSRTVSRAGGERREEGSRSLRREKRRGSGRRRRDGE